MEGPRRCGSDVRHAAKTADLVVEAIHLDLTPISSTAITSITHAYLNADSTTFCFGILVIYYSLFTIS